ncbi:MAG TPA: bile acid:sodium symporter [Nocardioides sp.]
MPAAASRHVTRVVGWLERRQVAVYLGAILLAGLGGVLVPGAERLDVAINPVLGLLLFATFLGVPFAALGRALRDVRFVTALLVLNFLVVPVVVGVLTRFVAGDRAVLVGVLLVLLTPCIDYVIVFSGLAGAASERLLAAAPLLMLAQLALLPLYLWLFVGREVADVVEAGPFVHALLVLVVLPLAAAALVQRAARRLRAARFVMDVAVAAMVPLMAATLVVVVASQVPGIASGRLATLLGVVPLYVAFLAVMAPLGAVAARVARLDPPAGRALVFSGATRNSLVVLPLALSLPDAYALAALVVVTQTLVELVGMVVYVRVVPRLVPTSVT